MEVRWSLPAAEDLERICECIERDNPEAAYAIEISRIFHSAQDWP
ncbi:MAG: hypothetical protein ABSG65_02895 [Bryobacteraceae bacterium]|jgi:plasmid stabilization system protein ParE